MRNHRDRWGFVHVLPQAEPERFDCRRPQPSPSPTGLALQLFRYDLGPQASASPLRKAPPSVGILPLCRIYATEHRCVLKCLVGALLRPPVVRPSRPAPQRTIAAERAARRPQTTATLLSSKRNSPSVAHAMYHSTTTGSYKLGLSTSLGLPPADRYAFSRPGFVRSSSFQGAGVDGSRGSAGAPGDGGAPPLWATGGRRTQWRRAPEDGRVGLGEVPVPVMWTLRG